MNEIFKRIRLVNIPLYRRIGDIDVEVDMANETIKALLMITLFGTLQIALHLPGLLNSPNWKRVRRAMVPHWAAYVPTFALAPIRIQFGKR